LIGINPFASPLQILNYCSFSSIHQEEEEEEEGEKEEEEEEEKRSGNSIRKIL
jgi:hypothetical protein